MLIEIPVTITFDHQSPSCPGGEATSRVFTMRYDTTDTDLPAQWTNHYPPRPTSHWITDTQGVLFDLFTSSADHAITRMAHQDPETYRAGVGA